MKSKKHGSDTKSIPLKSSQFDVADNRNTKQKKRHKQLSKVRKGR